MSARPEHDRIAELLPWFVNGTLDEAERAVVERHVRECLPCRMSLQDERRMARLIQAQPLGPLSASANFGRLTQRIDREAAPATNGRRRDRRIGRA